MTSMDFRNWDPLPVEEVAELLAGLEVPWWIAGGHAIDLFAGHQTRPHGDTDVLIRRQDQLDVQAHLSGWDLYRATYPGLVPWEEGEFLTGRYRDIWCRPHHGAPWKLQFMLQDTEGEWWLFKRDRSIRRRLSDITCHTPAGVPYLAPEVQLLHKARLPILDKDAADFDVALPLMGKRARSCLLGCLEKQFPEGHRWIERLRGREDGPPGSVPSRRNDARLRD
jgi:hypothetical protein